MSNVVALVPLRGGSKSIPDKNIRLIAGKPLCAWVLEAACQSGVFSAVVVSTDSEKISQLVRQLDLPVSILKRPSELGSDTASTESVMLHALQSLDFDVLATIQATSPMVTDEDFRCAFKLFVEGGYDSLLTAVRTKRFFWQDGGIALNYDPHSRPRRQDFAGSLMENGAFYFTKRDILKNQECRLGGHIGIYEMTADSAVEIDEPEDWKTVEKYLLNRKENSCREVLKNIRLLVMDVDGTLTDAGMYWSPQGDLLKKFNTRDAKGIELVRTVGVEVVIMTSEDSPIVKARAAKLGINHAYVGINNKRELLLRLVGELDISLDETAYIGDDLNDLECLKMVGCSSCPSDAVAAVKEIVCFVSKSPGGMGAVRELCDMIFYCKTDELTFV